MSISLVLAGPRESGCDVAQGFLLARPMPLNEMRRWLRAAGSTRAAA